MAVTQLTNAIIPSVYLSYSALNSPERTFLFDSGIITKNPVLDAIARQGGKTAELPFWLDLDATIEENYSNDDPADLAVPNLITADSMKARKSYVNQGFSAMDLVAELAGSNPMQRIRDRFSTYWARRLQRKLVAIATGIIADNVANDASDMGLDISALSGGSEIFNREAFVDAAYTMGEETDGLGVVVMHPLIKARAVKNNDVITIPDSQGNLTIPTYMGKRLVTSSAMTVTGSGVNKVFTTLIFGSGAFGFGDVPGGAFGFGEGTPLVPVEVERLPRAGSGGGQETIWERNTWLLHPFGFDWIEAGGGALTEFSPTNADLALAAKWDRVVAREQVPMAWLKSKA